MSKAAIIKSGVQPTEQTQSITISNSPPKSLSFSDTIKELINIWRNSLSVKIISGFILVFIFLIAFIAINGNSIVQTNSPKLKDEREKYVVGGSSILDLDSQKNILHATVKTNYGRIQELKENIQKTSKANSELEKKIEQQGIGIMALKNKLLVPKKVEVSVPRQNSRLQQKKTEKNGQLAQTQEEIEELGYEIDIQDYIKFGLFGSLGINVGGLIGVLNLISCLNPIKERTAEETKINRDLMDRFNKTNGTYEKLNKQVYELQGEANRIERDLESCNREKRYSLYDLEKCQNETDDLYNKTRPFIALGLKQAENQILTYMNKNRYQITQVFNSSLYGFSRRMLFERMKGFSRAIVVIKTESGDVFGAVLNVTWAQTEYFQEDPTAFTFSTMNDKICEIKDKSHAIRFSNDFFLEIGEGEIMIASGDSTTTGGGATADKTFNCAASDSERFYAESRRFTVAEVTVYAVKHYT